MRKIFTILFISLLLLQANTVLGGSALPTNIFTQQDKDDIQISTSIEGDRVLVSWNVFSQKRLQSIRVYRSTDGIDFNSIYSSSSDSFDFSDHLTSSEQKTTYIYYKVKAVFADGSVLLSGLEKINLNEARSLKPIIYTSGGQINLEFFNSAYGSMTAQIFNTTSRLVKQELYTPIQGNNRISIDAGNLRSGMYFLRLEQNGKVTTTKFFIR